MKRKAHHLMSETRPNSASPPSVSPAPRDVPAAQEMQAEHRKGLLPELYFAGVRGRSLGSRPSATSSSGLPSRFWWSRWRCRGTTPS